MFYCYIFVIYVLLLYICYIKFHVIVCHIFVKQCIASIFSVVIKRLNFVYLLSVLILFYTKS